MYPIFAFDRVTKKRKKKGKKREKERMPYRENTYISYASQIFHFTEKADVRCL